MKTLIALLVCVLSATLAGAQPKHVIVVMVDDLDVATTQEMLATGLLPTLQARFVTPGVTLAQHVASDPRCCPARAMFLTAQYPHNSGVRDQLSLPLLREDLALPCALPASYWSVFVGKYLNGYGSDATEPVSHPRNPLHRPPCWSHWEGLLDFTTYTAYDYMIHDSVNGQSTITDHRPFGAVAWNYSTDMLTIRSLFAMSEAHDRGQPLFLVVNYVAPHFHAESRDSTRLVNLCQDTAGLRAPFTTTDNLFGVAQHAAPRYEGTLADNPLYNMQLSPAFNEADVSDKAAWMQARPSLTAPDLACLQKQDRRRKESMRAVDDGLAAIFGLLDAYGWTQNTYVVFTSDNGFLRGEHRLTEKTVFYRESRTVPLYVRGPGLTPRTVTQLTSHADLAPTLAAWTGATLKAPADGRSLMPLLTGAAVTWRNGLLLESYGNTIIDGGLSGVLGDYPIPPTDLYGLVTVQPPRLYIGASDTQGAELYDLSTDPFEQQNIASDPSRSTELTALNAALTALRSCAGLLCILTEALLHVP